jgi:hypothetical protein
MGKDQRISLSIKKSIQLAFIIAVFAFSYSLNAIDFLDENNRARNELRRVDSHEGLKGLTQAACHNLAYNVDTTRVATKDERRIIVQSIITSAIVGGDRAFNELTPAHYANPALMSNSTYRWHLAAVLSIYEAARVVVSYGGHIFGSMSDIAAEVDLKGYKELQGMPLNAGAIESLLGGDFIDLFFQVATYNHPSAVKKGIYVYPDMQKEGWALQVWAHQHGLTDEVTLKTSESRPDHETYYLDNRPIAQVKPRGVTLLRSGPRYRVDNHELACTRIAKLLGIDDIIAPVYALDSKKTVEKFIYFEMPPSEGDRTDFQKSVHLLNERTSKIISGSYPLAYLVPAELSQDINGFIARPGWRERYRSMPNMSIEEISHYFQNMRSVIKPEQLAKLMVYWYVCILVDFHRGNIMVDEKGNLYAIDAEYSLSATQIDENMKKRFALSQLPGFLGLPGMRGKAPHLDLKRPSREQLQRVFTKYDIADFEAFTKRVTKAQRIDWETNTLNEAFIQLFNGDYYRRDNNMVLIVDYEAGPCGGPEGEHLKVGSLGPFDFPDIASTITLSDSGFRDSFFQWKGKRYKLTPNLGVNDH